MKKQLLRDPVLQEEELFCALKKQQGILFSKQVAGLVHPIVIRSLQPQIDLACIHQWLHMPYAKQFWQMDIGLDELGAFYTGIMEAAHTHSLVASYEEQLVAQIDLYRAQEDVVAKCYPVLPNDYGIHFLMAPLRQRIPLFSTLIFSAAVELLFQFRCVQRIVGEPDSRNAKANALVQRVGFRLQQQIVLPDKVANLYFCERSTQVIFK